jgi:hypothetical protein
MDEDKRFTAKFTAIGGGDPNPPAFTAFSVLGQTAVIDAASRTVKATVACGTNLTALTPTFTLTPAGATAKVNGNVQTSGVTEVDFSEPVTYTLATADGQTTAVWTVTVTLPDDCPPPVGDKKYITYNEPVTAYYIEYNGGMIEANEGDGIWAGNLSIVVEAYENKKYTEITWEKSYGWYARYIGTDGFQYDATYGSTLWYKHGEPVYDGEWSNQIYKQHEYPMGEFAAYVSKLKLGGSFVQLKYPLWEIAGDPANYELPNNTDVTEFYVGSEKIMDIMCDKYQAKQNISYGTNTWTFWVDPATGFTLKYDFAGYDGDTKSYEVSKLVIGKPDWDGKHLHPLASDTIEIVD